MKKIQYITASFLLLLSFAFISCGDNEERKLSVLGEWDVYDRVVKCYGNGEVEAEASIVQEDLQSLFKNKMKTHNFVLAFGEVYDSELGRNMYTESILEKKPENGVPLDKILDGSYKEIEGGLNVHISQAMWGNWETIFKIKDQNAEFMMIEQDLTSEDIKIIREIYFKSAGEIDKRITGKLTTYVVKKKNPI